MQLTISNKLAMIMIEGRMIYRALVLMIVVSLSFISLSQAEDFLVPESDWNQLSETEKSQIMTIAKSSFGDSVDIVPSDVAEPAFFGPFRKDKQLCAISCMVSQLGFGMACGAAGFTTGGVGEVLCAGLGVNMAEWCTNKCNSIP